MKKTNQPVALKNIIHDILEKIPQSQKMRYMESARTILPEILPTQYKKSYEIVTYKEDQHLLIINVVNGMLVQFFRQQEQRLLKQFNICLKQTHPELPALKQFKWQVNPHLSLGYADEQTRTQYAKNPPFLFEHLSEKAEAAMADLIQITTHPALKKRLQAILNRAKPIKKD